MCSEKGDVRVQPAAKGGIAVAYCRCVGIGGEEGENGDNGCSRSHVAEDGVGFAVDVEVIIGIDKYRVNSFRSTEKRVHGSAAMLKLCNE